MSSDIMDGLESVGRTDPSMHCSNRDDTEKGGTVSYRAEKKSLQILLSSSQAGPGRKVKQEQEEISRNHVPRLFLGSVCTEMAKKECKFC